MKIIKNIIAILCILIIVCMGFATFIEATNGTPFVQEHIYGSWWLITSWIIAAIASIIYFISRKIKKSSTIFLHVSFLIILIGALLTHCFSSQGFVRLRTGREVSEYTDVNNQVHQLPFSIALDRFEIENYAGTNTASDYFSFLIIRDNGKEFSTRVSMNKIFSYKGIRLYQSAYDEDFCGTALSLNSDPIGIPVTYTGYALLFISMIWLLVDSKGTFRKALSTQLSKGFTLAALILMSSLTFNTKAATTVSPELANKFRELYILYNGRICPMETFAIDFVKQVDKDGNYDEYTPEQLLLGFTLWENEWALEPCIGEKGSIIDYNRILKIFPHNYDNTVTWVSPSDKPLKGMTTEQCLYIQNVLPLLKEAVTAGDNTLANKIVDKMIVYQQKYGGNSLPSNLQRNAEHINNTVHFATILSMSCLTIGLLLLIIYIVSLVKSRDILNRKLHIFVNVITYIVTLMLIASFVIRWIICNRAPLTNGYETMMFVAMLVMIITSITKNKLQIVLPFGFLSSGFFLLVSHINEMSSAIGNAMPVLNSPLLSIHVSMIMLAYALLSLTFISSTTALFINIKHKYPEQTVSLRQFNTIMLYPALTTLTIGIFVGAIWANVSWGTYWSWDPKEVWALITLLVYSAPVHGQSFKSFSNPTFYNAYFAIAFITVLMTFFGVNYFLGGMHSYA